MGSRRMQSLYVNFNIYVHPHSSSLPQIESSAVCKGGFRERKERRGIGAWIITHFVFLCTDVSPCQKPDQLWCCEQVFPVSLSPLVTPGGVKGNLATPPDLLPVILEGEKKNLIGLDKLTKFPAQRHLGIRIL